MKQFITGGAGFIGSNYVRYILNNTDDEVTVFDALTYAGNLSTMRDVENNSRYKFVKGNICDAAAVADAMKGHDAVVHFAAESHVDRSIDGSEDFIHTNCFGTNTVIDTARKLDVSKVLHIHRLKLIRLNPARRIRLLKLDPTSSRSRITTRTELQLWSRVAQITLGHTNTQKKRFRCSLPTCLMARKFRCMAMA
jgi:hypothetical protein